MDVSCSDPVATRSRGCDVGEGRGSDCVSRRSGDGAPFTSEVAVLDTKL
jgi:hypothetical protein